MAWASVPLVGRSHNTREELLEAGRLFREVSGYKALAWGEIKHAGGH